MLIERDNHIREVLREFNWAKIHKVMKVLDWQWAPINRVPTIGELKDQARRILEAAWDCKGRTEIGGLVAEYEDKSLYLSFCVDQVSSWYLNEDLDDLVDDGLGRRILEVEIQFDPGRKVSHV